MAGTTSAIVREVISTSQKQVSKAVFNGYNLTFTVESIEDVVKKVEVTGSKVPNTAPGAAPIMTNFQGSVSETGVVSFNPIQSEISTADVTVIINEMLAIKAGTATV